MKIDRFNEAKTDNITGDIVIPTKVNVRFKISKSRKFTGCYSVRAFIDGISIGGNDFEGKLLAQGIKQEEIQKEIDDFMAKISQLHKTAQRFDM